jgi:hypothetical protein
VIPLCLIAGSVFAAKFDFKSKITEYTVPLAISFFIFSLQFIDHYTPSLYPKTEFLNRMISFKWNFLYPFMGGSGPLPFYVSFLFMALVWAGFAVLTLLYFLKKNYRNRILIGALILGLMYNAVFIEEYLFGWINGNSSTLVREAAAFIKENDVVSKVTVYNDNGGFDVMQTGKYRKRLYIDPKFDLNDKIKTLNTYKEFYLVVDIPHIDANTVYAKYFSTCKTIYSRKSGKIDSFVYDCRQAPTLPSVENN